jgi:hypothetical protein
LLTTSFVISLKILDFGLARVASDGVHTGYVATRYVAHSSLVFKNVKNLFY